MFCAHPYIATTFAMSPFHPFWRRPIYPNKLIDLLLKRWRTTPYVLRYVLLEKSTMPRIFGWRYSMFLWNFSANQEVQTASQHRSHHHRHLHHRENLKCNPCSVRLRNLIFIPEVICLTCLRSKFIMGCGKYTTRKLIFLLTVIAWVIKWKPLARSCRIVRGDAVFQEIWNSWVHWRRQVMTSPWYSKDYFTVRAELGTSSRVNYFCFVSRLRKTAGSCSVYRKPCIRISMRRPAILTEAFVIVPNVSSNSH